MLNSFISISISIQYESFLTHMAGPKVSPRKKKYEPKKNTNACQYPEDIKHIDKHYLMITKGAKKALKELKSTRF